MSLTKTLRRWWWWCCGVKRGTRQQQQQQQHHRCCIPPFHLGWGMQIETYKKSRLLYWTHGTPRERNKKSVKKLNRVQIFTKIFEQFLVPFSLMLILQQLVKLNLINYILNWTWLPAKNSQNYFLRVKMCDIQFNLYYYYYFKKELYLLIKVK